MTIAAPLAGLLFCCASCDTLQGLAAYHQLGKSLSTPAVAGKARLDMHQGLAVVHLYGTPQEMGQQYGTLMRTPLWAVHVYLTAFLPEAKRKTFLDYAAAHEPYLPEPIREEIKAIADASGMPYQELVALNIIPRTTCSGLAVWPDSPVDPNTRETPAESLRGTTLVSLTTGGSATTQPAGLIMGRNADYHSMGLSDRGALVVVYHPIDGLAVASVTYLGMVGSFTGMNEKGVSFGNMLVFNAAGPPRNEAGLTIQLAQRRAAEKAQNAQEMSRLLRCDPMVVPMNVMVADGREALVLELGVTGQAVREGDGGVLAVSNYFHTPELRTSDEACPRYDSLLAAGRKAQGSGGGGSGGGASGGGASGGGGMTVPAMEKALYDARIDKFNIQAVVFEPAARRMHVSVNRIPAAAGPFVTLTMDELLAPPPAPAPAPAPQPATAAAGQ